MAIILIDEVITNASYMNKAIEFISKYLTCKFAGFYPDKIIKPSPNKNYYRATIEQKLLRLRILERFDSNLVTEYDCGSYSPLHLSNGYIGKIKYLQDNGNLVIVLCDPTKFSADIKQIEGTYFINHYAEELDSNFSTWISGLQSEMIKNIISPTCSKPLPNVELCQSYHDVLRRISQGKGDKKSDYISVASEVARRNGYVRATDVEKRNQRKNTIRHIFVCEAEEKVFVSIDVEKGTLEACNKKGKHLGEYNYVGKQTDPPDKSGKHDIKV